MTASTDTPVAPPSTSGAVAIRNLHAQIEGLELRALHGASTLAERAALTESLSLRAHVVSCIADAERVERLADELVRDAPEAAPAWLARARSRGLFHRFCEALGDLDAAQQHGSDPAVVDDERAAIHQALGRYDEALTARQAAAERSRSFRSLVALAAIHAERGESDRADNLYREGQRLYQGVSPFPLAMLDLQRGHMWLGERELSRARNQFQAALRRLPQYAPAGGHLAEVEARLGDHAAAVGLLRPLARSSDDPEYAARLARSLRAVGQAEESEYWRSLAERRYGELLGRHLSAYADHAADFFLDGGADPRRATELARINLRIRDTPRARALVARAMNAKPTPKSTGGR